MDRGAALAGEAGRQALQKKLLNEGKAYAAMKGRELLQGAQGAQGEQGAQEEQSESDSRTYC